MSRRAALITTADLRRMAQVVRDEGVTFRGSIDMGSGRLSFSIAPLAARLPEATTDDLDDRLEEFGSR